MEWAAAGGAVVAVIFVAAIVIAVRRGREALGDPDEAAGMDFADTSYLGFFMSLLRGDGRKP